jgi:hypothetical protein
MTLEMPRLAVTCSSAALLDRQHQTARFGAVQRGGKMARGHGMMALRVEQRGGHLQPLFGLEHRARGEALLAASVCPQADQIGRAAHRRQHGVELVLPLAVPVHERGKVAGRECGLLVGDGIERNAGAFEDLLAIASGNGKMLFQPLAHQAFLRHARCGRADLVLRLQVNALGLQTAVIDPRVDIELRQPAIDVLGPGFAPVGQQLGLVPLAHLGAEPILADFAHAQHHMGMGFGEAVGSDIPMHIEIGDHAPVDELLLHKVPRQFDAIGLGHLTGNGELDLAGELRVLAHFDGFDIVPQLRPVAPFLRRAFGQHFAVHDAGLVGEIVVPIEPLIIEPIGRAIGSGGHGARAGSARNDFGREVVDRHGDTRYA